MLKRTTLSLVLALLGSVGARAGEGSFDLRSQVDVYKQKYNLRNPYDKLVDNHGDGDDDLYGVRNLRVVLHGVYYRGGANNKFNRIFRRANSNPLQDHALENLCDNGFSESVYLYPERYDTARKVTKCRDFRREDLTLNYRQISAFDRKNEEALLTKVYEHIKGITPGPLYGHCWNGWHASGLMAALSLRQYCGWSAEAAVDYWKRNTDGDSNFPSVWKRIREFRPIEKLKISAGESELICP